MYNKNIICDCPKNNNVGVLDFIDDYRKDLLDTLKTKTKVTTGDDLD